MFQCRGWKKGLPSSHYHTHSGSAFGYRWDGDCGILCLSCFHNPHLFLRSRKLGNYSSQTSKPVGLQLDFIGVRQLCTIWRDEKQTKKPHFSSSSSCKSVDMGRQVILGFTSNFQELKTSKISGDGFPEIF